MDKLLNLSEEECERVDQGIEDAFEFVREILDDPTILEQLPDGSHLKVIPHDQQDLTEHYEVTTPNIAVKVISRPSISQQP